MPNMHITSFVTDKDKLAIGDSLIYEVCMKNEGTFGDIVVKSGFGYKEFTSTPVTFIGDGMGGGYIYEDIANVIVGENLCPYGTVQLIKEVVDAKNSGKDVRFWVVTQGDVINKDIQFISEPETYCLQKFRIVDQDGDPLNGVITSPTWDVDLQVPYTGEASMYMKKGVRHNIDVSHSGMHINWNFTTCTTEPIVFVFDIAKYCKQTIVVIDENNKPIPNLVVKVEGATISSTDNNGKVYIDSLVKYKSYKISILKQDAPGPTVLYNNSFIACDYSNILTIKLNTKCVSRTNRIECESSGCFWWTDNTCQGAPEGTTDIINIHVKPYSHYVTNYDGFITDLLSKEAEISGELSNYFADYTGYKYLGLKIIRVEEKKEATISIYVNTSYGVSSLAIQIGVGAAVAIIVLTICIAFLIGYVVGIDSKEFNKEEQIELVDEKTKNDKEACMRLYPNRKTDPIEAKGYANCYAASQMGRAVTSADIVGEDSTEAVNFIDTTVNKIETDIDEGNIDISEIETEVDNKIVSNIDEYIKLFKNIAREQDCFFEVFGECLISNSTARTMGIVGAVGTIIYLLSRRK